MNLTSLARHHRPALLPVLTLCCAVLTASPAAHSAEGKSTNDTAQEEVGKKRTFSFDGGSPIDLIVAMDRHFRTRLVQILTLPESLSRTKVPKLRVPAEDPREVLTLYNRLQSPTLGQWRFEPETKSSGTNMNVLMLVPDKTSASSTPGRPGTRVKGVALAGVPDSKWEILVRDIDQAKAYGEELGKGSGETFSGTIRIQPDSKILIVAGSDAYLEMVESLVEAHRTNAGIESKGVETKKPDAAR